MLRPFFLAVLALLGLVCSASSSNKMSARHSPLLSFAKDKPAAASSKQLRRGLTAWDENNQPYGLSSNYVMNPTRSAQANDGYSVAAVASGFTFGGNTYKQPLMAMTQDPSSGNLVTIYTGHYFEFYQQQIDGSAGSGDSFGYQVQVCHTSSLM